MDVGVTTSTVSSSSLFPPLHAQGVTAMSVTGALLDNLHLLPTPANQWQTYMIEKEHHAIPSTADKLINCNINRHFSEEPNRSKNYDKNTASTGNQVNYYTGDHSRNDADRGQSDNSEKDDNIDEHDIAANKERTSAMNITEDMMNTKKMTMMLAFPTTKEETLMKKWNQ